MFKNHSLESKQIYQIELITLAVIAIICSVINGVKVTQTIKPLELPAPNTVRQQQLQNALQILSK